MINKYRFYSMWILAIVVLLMIGTCKISQAENKWNILLMDMSISERNYALGMTVISTGFKCDRPTESFFMGTDHKNSTYWSIQCSYNKAYCVTFGDDLNNISGNIEVMGCNTLKSYGVNCFEKF